jgi:hypothetical protein
MYALMKIIFSRKGFDSASGGYPSPIFPDNRMLSLPIPDDNSKILYKEITYNHDKMGSLVSDLTNGRVGPDHGAHLDPDIRPDSIKRDREWRPIFGQTGTAQGHLRRNEIGGGDIFLFFGLFRKVIKNNGKFKWDKDTPRQHVLWGWMQIDEIMKVDDCQYTWAKYHPHFSRPENSNNVIYIAKEHKGAGIFSSFSKSLVLTDPESESPGQWKLPGWFFPKNGKSPLTYHSDLNRWKKSNGAARLKVVDRGQEFILDTKDFPESVDWLGKLLTENSAAS